MSVMAVWAETSAVPDMPSTARPRNSSGSDPARPRMREPTAEPNSEMTSTGLRPIRSDSAPTKGESTNWASANTETSAVTCSGPAP